ncbi:MAG TPA: patatin-like phospholipase family protein, partial [Thermoanaerobaculia bacterium]|nr:patatin-like phospholipase family protein [Thermoanaerobaculia bacterium]
MTGFFVVLAIIALLPLLIWVQRRCDTVLPYIFFCRFPLVFALALALVPLVAIQGAPSLLANLFWLSRDEIVLVSFLATLAGWVGLITLEIILAYGPSRFGVPRPPLPRRLLRYRVPLFALLGLPVILTAAVQSPPPLFGNLRSAAGGIALASLLFVLASRLYKRWGGSIPLVQEAPSRPDTASQGYALPGVGRLGNGHILASVAFLLVTLLYVLGYLLLRPDRGSMPSLGYLLLLFLLVGWFLPGVSFFLDRYRVPVVLVLLAISFLSNQIFDTDHFYPIQRETAQPAPLPSQAFRASRGLAPEDRPIVVVAASGGGITASLWTAQVLTSLQREVGEDFTRSIRLISSVSGGSVGTMYYLDRFDEEGFPPPGSLAGILEAAGASSLDATAWGITYPDFWRVFLGFFVTDRTLDRGWAMEQVWKRHLREPDRMLSDWRTGLRQGWLPAAVLNATVVETGEQFLLTNLDLPRSWSARRFYDAYPGYDVPVVTAARLSATFPWVSPISQALGENGEPPGSSRQLHLADGGYYDNFGVVTAVNWLRSLTATPQLEELRRRGVILVLIRAFPEGKKDGGGQDVERGWFYATGGPILTMYNVRTSSQSFHNSV